METQKEVPNTTSTRNKWAERVVTHKYPTRFKSQAIHTLIVNEAISQHPPWNNKINSVQTVLEPDLERINAVLDPKTGKMLEYRQLIKYPLTKKEWSILAANEFGRLMKVLKRESKEQRP